MAVTTTLAPTPALVSAQTGKRMISVDVLRGLTIIAMVWVNDMADLVPVKPGVPQWMHHMREGVEGFTFVDLIIPTFMFLLGMSIPLALGKRLAKGDSVLAVIGHILLRSVSLMIMGLFDVNRVHGTLGPTYADNLDWPHALWKFLAWTFILIVWLDFPIESGDPEKRMRKIARREGARFAALLGLVWLAVVFRSSMGNPPKVGYFTTSWWGTLGQLGWAYLAASLTWLVVRNRRWGILIVFVLMHAAYLRLQTYVWPSPGDASHAIANFIHQLVDFIKSTTLTTYAANTMAGLCIGTLLTEKTSSYKRNIAWAVGLACFAGAMVFVLRGVAAHVMAAAQAANDPARLAFAKSLTSATSLHLPYDCWSLAATSIALIVWSSLYFVTDVCGLFTKALDPLRTVGQNSLMIYQFARYGIMLYWVLGLTFYDRLAAAPLDPNAVNVVGIMRSLTYALVLAAITYVLTKKRVFLKV